MLGHLLQEQATERFQGGGTDVSTWGSKRTNEGREKKDKTKVKERLRKRSREAKEGFKPRARKNRGFFLRKKCFERNHAGRKQSNIAKEAKAAM
jgi:hypothetical protein